MPAPQIIHDLVDRFDRNLAAYKSPAYNETQVRREFIDPFFKALGWDVDNEQGYAEQYKDVVHEDAVKIGVSTKAPDYSFRIGGVRKFFLEAKKPSVNLKDDPAPAYQLRRYAWSAKLPVSVLTDFEEFIVYDTRIKPASGDKAAIGRVLYISYRDYVRRWDEIEGIFSRDAILKGSFDKYVESAARKRGTEEVDDAFLAEIEEWRKTLAQHLALRNPRLSQRELNFAVQCTIDRIIFLRICEDRGIEEYGRLQGLLNGASTYDRLKELFYEADFRYNSGLFYFSADKDRSGAHDTLTPSLKMDDKTLKDLLRRLYPPESPYEFSAIPADILGQIYERFLGSVIRLTAGHQARVETKLEVRKAGGVYYTPTYIVDYLVKQTVGKLLEGCTPGPRGTAAQLRILDPACGSGSFLLGVYEHLLQWHLAAYEREPEKWSKGKSPAIFRHQYGWRLTTTERKRILLANIYGVDIDQQAVEVTKLSLLLKVLEDATADVLAREHAFYKERALPDLAQNIKCGNSLIGPDFFNGHQMDLFDDEEMLRINAFDWNREFRSILKDGGFDAVIGNPPYGMVFAKEDLPYLSEQYPVFRSIPDGYVAFVEKAHALLREKGRFGYIIPSAWLGGPRYRSLRAYLLGLSLETIVLLPYDIFRDAYIDTLLMTTVQTPPKKRHRLRTYEYPKKEKIQEIRIDQLATKFIEQEKWRTAEDQKFVLNPDLLGLISNLTDRTGHCFRDVVDMRRGVLFDPALLTNRKSGPNSYRYFEGNIYRYTTELVAPHWVEYGPQMSEWPKEFKWFEGERILLRRLVNRKQRLMASLISETVITNKNLYTLIPRGPESTNYLLGFLNSAILSRLYLAKVSQATKDDFPQVTIRDILNLPFRAIDFKNSKDKAAHDKMASLVERLMALHKRLPEAKTEHEKTALNRQILATDEQIDRLVYELYGLTDEEIALIEGTE